MPLIDSANEDGVHGNGRPSAVTRRRLGLIIGIIVLALAIVIAIAIASMLVITSVDRARPNIHRTVASSEGLTSALAEAKAVGGGSIRLAKGNYRLEHDMEIPANVTVDGQGSTIVVTSNGSDAVSLGDASGLKNLRIRASGRVAALVVVPGSASGVTISGCTLTGITGQSGIVAGAPVNRLTISDTSLNNVKNGITLKGAKDTTVEQVRVKDWTTHGVWVLGTGSNPATNVRLTGLNVGANVGVGQSRYPIAVMTSDGRNKDITVENSTVSGRGTAHNDRRRPGTADQISVTRTDGVLIQHDTSISGGDRGINVTSSSGVIVRHNVVARADASGIGIGSTGAGKGNSDVTVEDNRVSNCGLSRLGAAAMLPMERTGIRLVQVTHGIVSANRIAVTSRGGRETYGVTTYRDVGVSVTGNAMSGPMAQRVLRNAG